MTTARTAPPAPIAPIERLLALSIGLVLALSLALAFVLVRGGLGSTRAPETDEAVMDAAVAELIGRSSGTWDAYPDPDVGRVLLPNLEGREFQGKRVDSNRYGMRERQYGDKREGVVRVAIVGDSYVFGYGVEAEERLGVFLQEFLNKGRKRPAPPTEVLHLAVSSWNIRAECHYVRRQLADLEPDLVVLVTFKNDLSDVNGVRGFGEMSQFSSQARERGVSILNTAAPRGYWPGEGTTANLQTHGLDWESRHRYEAAGEDIRRLAEALGARGIPFLLVVHWHEWNAVATSYLAAGLDESQVLQLPSAFSEIPELWNKDDDRHWNRRGHERVATLLYAVIRERGLLPVLNLQAWEDAEAEHAWMIERQREEAAAPRAEDYDSLRPFLTAPPPDKKMVSQLYYGLDAEGRVEPYFSALLARRGGTELVISGSSLGRPALEHATAHVFVEELEVGSFPLGSEAAFPYTFALPAPILERDYVTVRVESDDWVYAKVVSGSTMSFLLEELRIR